MPPKKKKSGKKKGKKSGKKSGRGSPTKSSAETLNELSKEFYLVQIRDLENRLVRYVFMFYIVHIGKIFVYKVNT